MEIKVIIWDKKTSINGFTAEEILTMDHYGWVKSETAVLTLTGDHVLRIDDASILRSNYGWPNDMTNEELCSAYLEQQLKENNPDALLSPLEAKRQEVLQAIADRDKKSDVFHIKFGQDAPPFPMWLPVAVRTQLLTNTLPAQLKAGNQITNLWTETTPPIMLPIGTQWGIDNLPTVEVYALSTLDAKKRNEYKADVATTEEGLEAVKNDIESAYVGIEPVTLILPVEEMPEDVQAYYAELLQQFQI